MDIEGDTVISDLFSPLVKKDTILDDASPVVKEYYRTYGVYPSSLEYFSEDLYAWEGLGHTHWCTDTSDKRLLEMRRICKIKADLSGIRPEQLYGPKGIYWRVDYKIVILFEGAKMKAHLEWTEGRIKKRGPVTIVPALLY